MIIVNLPMSWSIVANRIQDQKSSLWQTTGEKTIKGGAPGQVVLSQLWGLNWLMSMVADPPVLTDKTRPVKADRDELNGIDYMFA
jgi:hypothetical protein